ncbi:MAG: hypothetical protein Q8Q94_00100 [bacterium]|nr:hypothetical protein [bacterium]MDZ4299362.1 hypothetical protein [Candidatus Sungbacteria bacterium]
MEATLIFAQTVFYFTVSLAVMAVGISCGIVTRRLVRIAREIENLSRNLNHASSEAGERINDIIERLSDIPILSFFLRKHSATHNGKGRGRSPHYVKKQHEQKSDE